MWKKNPLISSEFGTRREFFNREGGVGTYFSIVDIFV